MKQILLGLFFCCTISIHAQVTIEGTVIDYSSKRAMPFVNVVAYKKHKITADITDVEGRFNIKLSQTPDSVVFSFIGYAKKIYTKSVPKWIYLQPTETKLNVVDVKAGINPALRIIKNAINNKKENDVKYTHSYTHDSYTLFRADLDKKKNLPPIDSLTDSTTIQVLSYFNKRAAFRMETYSKVQYKPVNKKKETIIATRTSGFKSPMFAAIASQIQAFSAYDNPLNLFRSNYLNPISNRAYSDYFYVLQDTLYDDKDSVFIIDFHPKPGKDFKGLNGTLFIHSANWAIQNVIYNLKSLFGIVGSKDNPVTIAMSYEKQNDTTWFPIESKTIVPVSFITFVPSNSDSLASDSTKTNSDSTKLSSLGDFIVSNITTFKNVIIDPGKDALKFSGAPIEVKQGSNERSAEDWLKLRGDSLTTREKETYHYVDSVSQKFNLERRVNSLQALAKGNIRLKWFDLSILDVIQFNNFEGFRFGLGGSTNENLIPWLSIEAYGAYGLKDKRFKYGGGLNFHIVRSRNFNFHVYYHDDVKSTGYYESKEPKGMFNQSMLYRNIYANKMDYEQNLAFEIEGFVYKNIFLRLFNHNKRIWAGYNYQFKDPNNISDGQFFKVVETGVYLNWNIARKYIQLPFRRLNTGRAKFPEINATLVKGWNNIWFGQYNYLRAQLKINQQFTFLKLGHIDLQAEWNKIWGDVPVPLLLYTPGTFDHFGVTAPNNLETVRPSEFLNSQTVIGHFRFEFNPFKSKKGKYAPILSLRFSAAWGKLTYPLRHQKIAFNTMSKGFYEAGFVLDNLLPIRIMGLGIGFFHRFGPYNYAKEWDNMAIKLSIRFNLFNR